MSAFLWDLVLGFRKCRVYNGKDCVLGLTIPSSLPAELTTYTAVAHKNTAKGICLKP